MELRRKSTTILWLMSLVVTLALIAAACGSDRDDESDGPSADANGEPDAPSVDGGAETGTNAASGESASDGAADEPVEDATAPEPAADGDSTLVWALGSNGGNFFDPHMATNPFTRSWIYPFYDRLTQVDEDGSIQPMLATSWEFAEDGFALTLTIRQGVAFHDGEALDAAAVKANLDRARTRETGAGTWVDLLAVESVDVIDDFTVQLNLGAPGGALPGLLSDQAGMMISPMAFDNEDLATMPIGAGPFVATEFRVDESMSAVAFDDYWQTGLPRSQNLVLRFILDPNTRLNAIASGEVHGGSLDLGQNSRQDVADRGLEVTQRFSTALYQLFLNTQLVPEFANPDVRVALAMAIDQNAINQALFNGECQPNDQPFGKGWYAHNPNIDGDYHPYDPQAARALLNTAGVSGLEFTAITANIPSFVAQAEAVSGFLAEVGVKMTVAPTPIPELIAGFIINKNADAYWSLNPGAVDPAKIVSTIFLAQSPFNPGGYTAAGVFDAFVAGGQSTTTTGRAPVYQEMARLLADEQITIAVCTPANLQAHGSNVSGVRLLSTLSDVDVSRILVN